MMGIAWELDAFYQFGLSRHTILCGQLPTWVCFRLISNSCTTSIIPLPSLKWISAISYPDSFAQEQQSEVCSSTGSQLREADRR